MATTKQYNPVAEPDPLVPSGAVSKDDDASRGTTTSYDQSAQEISETTVVRTPIGDEASRTVQTTADLLLEYVGAAGSVYAPWMQIGYIKSLPNPSDDLIASFGSRLYDEDMMRDAQVSATMSILVMAVLAEGYRLEPPVKVGDPKYDAAKRINDFCIYVLDNTKHSFISILYELIEGMLQMGHKVGELIWDLSDKYQGSTEDGNTGEKVVLKDVKTKNHNATAFVVDGFMDELGLLYIRPGQAMPVLGTLPLNLAIPGGASPVQPGIQPIPDMIPRTKFIIPANKSKNGDPRGISHLKAVYTPWWQKLQWVPQHLAYVARFAQPSIWIKLPPEAKDIPITDAAGNVVKYKSIIQASNDAGVKLKGGAVATFVNADANMMESKTDAKVIFDSYDLSDRQIAKGILLQTLTTEEGKYMARAASTVHQDVFGIFLAYLRRHIEWCVREEILRKLVLYNFGEEASHNLCPTISLGDTEQQDVPAMVNALAALALAGGVHPSQWPGLWAKLDFPKADDAEWQKDQQILEAQREQDLELAQNPPPPIAMDPSGRPSTPQGGGAGGAVGAGGGAKSPSVPPPARSQPTSGPNKGPVDQIRKKTPTRESKINAA